MVANASAARHAPNLTGTRKLTPSIVVSQLPPGIGVLSLPAGTSAPGPITKSHSSAAVGSRDLGGFDWVAIWSAG